jgi:small subunit ribosomal protein S15
MNEAQFRNQTVQANRRHDKDSGSPEVQISLLTNDINFLSQHLQTHRKDNSSRRGLTLKVARRNRLLKYLSRTDKDGYTALIGRLGLRK